MSTIVAETVSSASLTSGHRAVTPGHGQSPRTKRPATTPLHVLAKFSRIGSCEKPTGANRAVSTPLTTHPVAHPSMQRVVSASQAVLKTEAQERHTKQPPPSLIEKHHKTTRVRFVQRNNKPNHTGTDSSTSELLKTGDISDSPIRSGVNEGGYFGDIEKLYIANKPSQVLCVPTGNYGLKSVNAGHREVSRAGQTSFRPFQELSFRVKDYLDCKISCQTRSVSFLELPYRNKNPPSTAVKTKDQATAQQSEDAALISSEQNGHSVAVPIETSATAVSGPELTKNKAVLDQPHQSGWTAINHNRELRWERTRSLKKAAPPIPTGATRVGEGIVWDVLVDTFFRMDIEAEVRIRRRRKADQSAAYRQRKSAAAGLTTRQTRRAKPDIVTKSAVILPIQEREETLSDDDLSVVSCEERSGEGVELSTEDMAQNISNIAPAKDWLPYGFPGTVLPSIEQEGMSNWTTEERHTVYSDSHTEPEETSASDSTRTIS